jgi:hypothetical protein
MPINGQQSLVFGSGDGGVWSLQPRTGKSIWHYNMSRAGINVGPLVDFDGRIYMSQGEENPIEFGGNTSGAVVALDGTKSGDLAGSEIWRHLNIMAGKASPVKVGDRVYFVDDRSKMHIFEAATGKQIAKDARVLSLGTMQRSTPLVADGKIYVMTNTGQWHILRPTETGVERVHTLRLSPDANGGSPESEGSMAVSHGKIYLPTSQALFCLGKPGVEPSADPLPQLPRESALTDTNEAQIQVIPYDALLKPGGEQAYRVRLFNAKGQFLREVPAAEITFSVDGIGAITSGGNYTAPADAGHDNTLVTCKVGSLTGTARVRITPPLPWKFDFNGANPVPLTWIGGRVRWDAREEGGEKFLYKKTLLPTAKDPKNKLGTRSFGWMWPIDLANYTIQGDVLMTKVDLGAEAESAGKSAETESNGGEAAGGRYRISDVGLINSRYQLTVRGLSKLVRIDSWAPSDYRTHKAATFDPDPDTWYTLKLRVEPQGSQALVQGKVWKRGDPEPPQWTVEMTDSMPNLHGTPGVYGNTPEAEVYLDNLSVTPN